MSKLDIKEIMRRLAPCAPHYMVDGVEEIAYPVISGFKNVSANEPHFKGHFPGNPIMPGVLQVEALVQLCRLLCTAEEAPFKASGLDLLNVKRMKFRRTVVPGDRLDLRAEAGEVSDSTVEIAVKAEVGGETACEGSLVFTLLRQ